MARSLATVVTDPFGWVGSTLDGKYRVDRVAAEGGCGVVYAGHHLGFDHPIAIKCLKLESFPTSRREVFLDSFREEGRIMSRLSQECISVVRPIDLGAAASPSGIWTPYLVLEWVEGTSLEDDLAERAARGLGGRSVAEAIDLLEPVARALETAHDLGIAHRDVKPGNLLIGLARGKQTVKILDFGVAKTMNDARIVAGAAVTAVGPKTFTTAFGAPEQFDPRLGATGPWTDVFAFALVFVTVIAGRRALEGEDPQLLWAQSVDLLTRPTPRRLGVSCSDELERVLTRALAVDPRNRHATLRELWPQLVAAAGSPVQSASPRAVRKITETDAGTPKGTEPPLELVAGVPPTLRDPTPLPPATGVASTPVLAASSAANPQSGSGVGLAPQSAGDAANSGPARIPPGPPSSRRPPGGGLPAMALGGFALLLVAIVIGLRRPPASTAALAQDAATSLLAAAADPVALGPNDGTDSNRPILALDDQGFVDRHAGWGWRDRCAANIQAKKWGWAKAECDEALKLNPASPDPRASLLYNEGLIAAQAGKIDEARTYYGESLRLRANKDVQAALAQLPACPSGLCAPAGPLASAGGSPDAAIATARAAAARDGWKPTRTTLIPGHTAAIVEYSGTRENAHVRLDFVGAGPAQSIEDSTLEIKRSSTGALWNFTGDGPRFAVVESTSCAANCTQPRQHTFELVGDTWRKPVAAPESPSKAMDEDHDGIPELPVVLHRLIVVGVPRVESVTSNRGVVLEGIEAWDGARFAKDLASFVPLYAKRLVKARADAAVARAAADKSGCTNALSALDAATRVFAYGAMSGVDRTAAMGEADTTLAGYSVTACNDEWATEGTFRDWPLLRAELWGAKLPALTRVRR